MSASRTRRENEVGSSTHYGSGDLNVKSPEVVDDGADAGRVNVVLSASLSLSLSVRPDSISVSATNRWMYVCVYVCCSVACVATSSNTLLSQQRVASK